MTSHDYRKDEGNDGIDEENFSYEWEYDLQGELYRKYVSPDDNGTSVSLFYETTWDNTYDTNGNILSQHYTKDNDLNGSLDTNVGIFGHTTTMVTLSLNMRVI